MKVVSKSSRNLFPVLSAGGQLLGIVSLDDIRKVMFDPNMYANTYVRDYMIRPAAGIDICDSMECVMKKFEDTRAWNLPVLKDGKYIGFVFQFHHLLEDFTALENIFLPAYLGGEPFKSAKKRAQTLIEKVGLASRADHFPAQLSGGECQRIAVARALINNPPLILADEPTGNLDETHSEKVEELLFDMVENEGKSLILVTHDLRLAEKGDARYVLTQGQLYSR